MTKFHTLYNKPPQISVKFLGETKTKQAPANEVDINKIMDKYLKTGQLPEPRTPTFGDATEIPDYETAMNIVNAGREAFEALPAKIRERFGNDPRLFVDFVQDENNYDEAVKLGLVAEKPKTTTQPVADSVATQAESVAAQPSEEG